MPGLLETPDDMFGSARFCCALVAEFLGSLIFAFLGSAILYVAITVTTTVGMSPLPNIIMAALGNGFTLACAIFVTANISGGHITPTVTIATMITGHIQILKGVCYVLSQIVGAVFASLIIAGLVPGSYIGMGNSGTGCFAPGADVSNAQLFGWEAMASFILVSVVYAVAIGNPSFGNIAPFAAGLSLVIDIFATAAFSGGGVSPARVLGPAVVFHCHWNKVWVYILGEVFGCIMAGVLAVPLYGGHAKYLDKALPWGYHHYESKSMQGAMVMDDGANNAAPNVPAAMAPGDSAHNGNAMAEKV